MSPFWHQSIFYVLLFWGADHLERCNDFVLKIAASSAAMTGEICAAMSRTHPRAYRVLLCKTRDL
jgi:hypothetical protein